MGFKENLKEALAYRGMLVKELAARSGVNRHTLDNYLNVRNCRPSAECAVKIARTLGVSVEYLVEGGDARRSEPLAKYLQYGSLIDDLSLLPKNVSAHLQAAIKALADQERRRPV